MSVVETAIRTKFHLSLNVSNLAGSVAFYRALFGLEPANLRHDYAKFELEEPPVVLSLIPASHAQGGALNHMGLRVPGAAELVEMQARLEAAGMPTQREEGVDCCYSRQTKFWIADFDRNLWEIYVLLDTPDGHVPDDHADEVPSAMRAAAAGAADSLPLTQAPEAAAAEPAFWQHFLTSPIPERIPHDDGSLDEVRLEGAFNMRLDAATRDAFLAEIRRVLRPGGRVLVHGLVADRPFPGEMPTLPGPAAWVQYVPQEAEPMQALVEAGFAGVRYTKLAERPNFALQGVEMREVNLVGTQPGGCSASCGGTVVYKGPFPQVTDEDGMVFPRGTRVRVHPLTWAALWASPVAEQFVFLPDQPATLPVIMGCCP
jgi:catechol 2,3-dioxygenase-like lactoylglutathione lyase family enzyme